MTKCSLPWTPRRSAPANEARSADRQQTLRESDQGADSWSVRRRVEGRDACSLGRHDGWVVRKENHPVQAGERSADPSRVLLVADAVGDDDESPQFALTDGHGRTTPHLQRLRGGLHDHDDDVDRVPFKTHDRAEPRFEVSDNQTVGTCKLPEQLLR